MNDLAAVSGVMVGLVLIVGAALHDVAVRTVPNRVAGSLAVIGLAVQALQGSLLVSAASAVAVFVAMALCWRRGWVGGGDVKLLAAAALLVPPGAIPGLICATALAGGVLAIFYLVARRRLPPPATGRPHRLLGRVLKAERWRLRRGGPMPYAVAIASGVLFVITHGGMP